MNAQPVHRGKTQIDRVSCAANIPTNTVITNNVSYRRNG